MTRTHVVLVSSLAVACGRAEHPLDPEPAEWETAVDLPLEHAPPPPPLSIQAGGPLEAGAATTIVVANALPGETVHLARSLVGVGAGPCVPALGGLCLDLLAPTLHGSTAADAAGVASFTLSVPAGAAGSWVGFQAAVQRGVGGSDSLESPPLANVVKAAPGAGFYTGPALISQIEMTCDPGGTAWRYRVHTVGWTSDALLNMSDTNNAPPWDEEHWLPSYDFDAMGWWDELQLELSSSSYVRDVSTLFRCDVHLVDGSMTWAVRVYDVDGNLGDCVALGHDPAGYIAGAYPPAYNYVTDPGEFAGCQIW